MRQVAEIITHVLAPGHFFVAHSLSLIWEEVPAETISWEVFRGRLLDRAQTRQQRTFHAWNIFLIEDGRLSAEPLLSLKWDKESQQMHIVRGLECHVWEGYTAEGNVVLSRETVRWVRELTGTVRLAEFADPAALEEELSGRLFQAVVGLSRLPLTSVEAPLPVFSLGRLAYVPVATDPSAAQPLRSCRALVPVAVTGPRTGPERARLLELFLRAAPREELPELTHLLVERWQATGTETSSLPGLLRKLLNDVSLSPYTQLVDHLLYFCRLLVENGALTPAGHMDFLGHPLRQIARHLTAYDLITFHHRGANYPDALLLDAVLKEYLEQMERRPDLLLPAPTDDGPQQQQKQRRRRGLRQGWLLRRFYEGLPVPDSPTSPGENTRVLPPPHVRVPEEQILNLGRRRRRLYADDPLDRYLGEQASQILHHSISDLHDPRELQELGMALFIDRPLGLLKAPGEPDQTLLFSHEAFSRSIALQRLGFLAGKAPAQYPWDNYRVMLQQQLAVQGLSARLWQQEQRGVVSLADAARAADDFLLLRTTPGTVQEFLRQYPVLEQVGPTDQDFLLRAEQVLIVPEPGQRAPNLTLAVYDGQLRQRLELSVDLSHGYRSRSGVEYPTAGLKVLEKVQGCG